MRNPPELDGFYMRTVDALYKFVKADKHEIFDYLDARYKDSAIKGVTFYNQIIEYTNSHPYAQQWSYNKKKKAIIKVCNAQISDRKNWLKKNDYQNLKWLITLLISLVALVLSNLKK